MTHPLIARAWVGTGRAATVLPDGCADLVWTGGRLVVAGPATRPVEVAATPAEPRFGVRLWAGGVEAALGVPGDALRDPRARLSEVARDVALGERQLRRRFDRAIGYGPRTFARIQRFQRLLLLHERDELATLARLAADAGYADQAHMTREVRRLSGRAPRDLLASGARAAGERSETFKSGPRPGRILTA